MTFSRMKALLLALGIHATILLFGGLLLFREPSRQDVEREVDLVDDVTPAEKTKEEKPKETPPEEAADKAEEALDTPQESAPDVRQVAALEGPAGAPALAALSLSDLEGALNPDLSGGGTFQEGVSFSSGGRIGGTGDPAAAAASAEAATFALADLDQRPRPLSQAMPRYPTELRKRKVEGTVEVVFLVDTDGRVLNPKVDKSTHEALNQPALEAVRQWKFEAGTKDGHKVRFKMKVPITFSAG
jgi:protein TonB